MYYYFSSNYPAVLKLNGIYYGTIHNTIKTCNVDNGEMPFVEVCPLNGKEKQVAIIIDEKFLSKPPEQITITDLDGGYLISFERSYFCDEFKIFCQQKYSDTVVTVFSENGYKLSIETSLDFYAESLKLEVSSAQVQRIDKHKNLVAVFLYGDKNLVNVYDISSNITKVFSQKVDSADFSDGLVTIETLSDMAKHKITTSWEYQDQQFIAKNKKIERLKAFDGDKLNPNLIPFAFLEEYLAGGDYKEYLTGTLLENAEKLVGFFGDFIGIMPPPIFRDIQEVGLICKTGKNLYQVKYLRFEIDKNKIVNVSKD